MRVVSEWNQSDMSISIGFFRMHESLTDRDRARKVRSEPVESQPIIQIIDDQEA